MRRQKNFPVGGVTCSSEKPSASHFDSYMQSLMGSAARSGDEVDQYLGTTPEPKCNVLDYWKRHESVYPMLVCMARDYLAVQSSSVDAERWFSKSGYVCTPLRNKLSPTTVQAIMCLESWYPTVPLYEDKAVIVD